jgi:hypothetical protein
MFLQRETSERETAFGKHQLYFSSPTNETRQFPLSDQEPGNQLPDRMNINFTKYDVAEINDFINRSLVIAPPSFPGSL